MAPKMSNRVTCVQIVGIGIVLLCFACSDKDDAQTPGASGVGGLAGMPGPTGGAVATGGTADTPTGGITDMSTGGTTDTSTGGTAIVPTGGAMPTGGMMPTGGTGGAIIVPDAAIVMPDSSVVSDAAVDAVAPVEAGADVPITGTFPAVTDPWSQGPYTAKTVNNTGPGNVYTLYHPTELAPNGVPNPIITWGNGGGTTPALYPMLPFFATHGFVVIASNNTMASGQLLSDGVDWLIEQNNNPSSEFHNKLDIDNIGAMGYSMGSLAVYEMLTYPNLVTTVHMSGGLFADSSHDAILQEPGPTAYICDATSTSAGGTKENCDTDYDVVQVPVFYGAFPGANHVAMMFPPYSDMIAGAATAWFRWHLMADESQRPVFVGPDCQLCQDPAWIVQQKNW